METITSHEAAPPAGRRKDGTGVCLHCFARPDALLAAWADRPRGALGAVEVEDVAAVFSLVPLDEFRGLDSRKNLENPAWIVPRACRHEEVVERVMARSPVLPVRFGAVFSSPQRLRSLLAKNRPEISWFLDLMADKEEWSVKGFADPEKTREWVRHSDPDFLRKRGHAPASPGSRYLFERHLDVHAGKLATRLSRLAAERALAELQGRAPRVCPLPLRRRKCSPGRDEEMIFHCAFLVRRERVADFRARVETIDANQRRQGLKFEASGPWPPYHFCPSIGEATP